MCARLGSRNSGPLLGQDSEAGRGSLIQVSGDATQRAPLLQTWPTIDQAIDVPGRNAAEASPDLASGDQRPEQSDRRAARGRQRSDIDFPSA